MAAPPTPETSGEPGERRPIATREAGWAKAASSALARAGATPNGISVAGMFAGMLAGVALSATRGADGAAQRALWIAGALFIQLRLLSNMLDGMVAVESGKSSPLGQLYNEVPDRISDAATLIGLGYAAGSDPLLGLAAACVAIFVAYVRVQARVAGAPMDFCGPQAKPHRMFVATLAALWAGLAPAAWQPAWGAEGRLGAAAAALGIVIAGGLFTAGRRLVRAAAHLEGPAR